MSWLVLGRPARFGQVHLRVIRRRCQAGCAPGVTSRRAQHGWQVPGQRGQDCPVGPVWLWPGHLTPEHRDLLTGHQDLGVLGRLAAAQQDQPAEDRTMIRQSSRTHRNGDPAATDPSGQTAAHSTCGEF